MELSEAIKKAENEGVKQLDGYYLGSCFACIKDSKGPVTEWTLLFFKGDKAIDCFVNEKFVRVSDDTRPIKDVKKMTFDATVTAESALKTANEKFGKSTINILITLHQKDVLVWTITMIDVTLTATSYDIDAKTGKIVNEESTSLIRKM